MDVKSSITGLVMGQRESRVNRTSPTLYQLNDRNPSTAAKTLVPFLAVSRILHVERGVDDDVVRIFGAEICRRINALAELNFAYAVFKEGEKLQGIGVCMVSDGSDLFKHINEYGLY
jgi:hypothetical protein